MQYPVKVMGSAVVAAAALALSASVPVQAQNQPNRNFCLNVTEIKNTQAVDRRTIIYRMKNGDVWRNTLAAPCPDLVGAGAGGYSQKVHTDWICANTQQIEVQATGMVCRLGEFTRVN
jgi:hypothetical protein